MMILQHNATLSWLVDGPLSACASRRVRARGAGRLTVSAGRAWITRPGDPDDHVLTVGQALSLHAHDEVVIGPWDDGSAVGLAWCGDQPRALATRVLDALAAAGRRLSALGLRGVVVARLSSLARSAAASDKRAQGSIARGESRACSGAVQ
jgi:hypothetical protein